MPGDQWVLYAAVIGAAVLVAITIRLRNRPRYGFGLKPERPLRVRRGYNPSEFVSRMPMMCCGEGEYRVARDEPTFHEGRPLHTMVLECNSCGETVQLWYAREDEQRDAIG